MLGSPGAWDWTEICGTAPDGCGGTLSCATCPSPLYRPFPGQPWLLGQNQVFTIAFAQSYRGARYGGSLLGIDLQSGVIVNEHEVAHDTSIMPGVTIDASRRYVSFVAPDMSIRTLDAATGLVRRRSALPAMPGFRMRVRALHELDASAERWMLYGELIAEPTTRRNAFWVIEQGRMLAEFDDVVVERFATLANGTLLAFGGDLRIARMSPQEVQRSAGMLVFPQGPTARPELVRTDAHNSASTIREYGCGGNLCFDTLGNRFDFSAGLQATAERLFELDLGRELPVLAVFADVAADELWYARQTTPPQGGVPQTAFYRFRLSTARAAAGIDVRGTPHVTLPLQGRLNTTLERVAPDAMLLGGVLIRDPRFVTAGR